MMFGDLPTLKHAFEIGGELAVDLSSKAEDKAQEIYHAMLRRLVKVRVEENKGQFGKNFRSEFVAIYSVSDAGRLYLH